MKSLFIDETSDATNPHYLGVCGALIDSSKYAELKQEYSRLMSLFGWDAATEFKGTMIFSQSQGCQSVSVARRVELTKAIIGLNSSTSNSRIKFYYASTPACSDKGSYLNLVGIVTSKIFDKSTTSKNGKNVVSVHCDDRDDVTVKELRKTIAPILERKGLILFEDAVQSRSSNETTGICIADIVAYLMSRIENLEPNWQNLKKVDPIIVQTNGQIKKLLASTEIVGMIKSIRKMRIRGEIDISANGAIRVFNSKDNLA